MAISPTAIQNFSGTMPPSGGTVGGPVTIHNNNFTNSASNVIQWIVHTGTTSGAGNTPITQSSGIVNNPVSGDDLLRALRNGGIRLDASRKLQMINDEVVVEVIHDDGRTSHRGLNHHHRGSIRLKHHHHLFKPGAAIQLPNGEVIQINADGGIDREILESVSGKLIHISGGSTTLYESLAYLHFNDIHIPAGTGRVATLTLPNGVEIHLHADDAVEVNEANGKQLYRSAPVRDFNKFLNASDLLEDFIRYCAAMRLSRKDFSELPISLFIYWLIVQAAEADGDPTDEILPMLTGAVTQQKKHTHKCKCCGKFLSRKMEEHSVAFCSPDHMARYMAKIA